MSVSFSKAAGFLIAIMMMATAAAVSEQTYGQEEEKLCPNAVSLEHTADEDHAVADRAQFAKYRQAARLYYLCSTNTPAGELHDLLKLSYGRDLLASIRTNADAVDVAPTIGSAMNELAYETQYSDIKKVALDIKQLARKAYDVAYNEIYGGTTTPSPEPSHPDDAANWQTNWVDMCPGAVSASQQLQSEEASYATSNPLDSQAGGERLVILSMSLALEFKDCASDWAARGNTYNEGHALMLEGQSDWTISKMQKVLGDSDFSDQLEDAWKNFDQAVRVLPPGTLRDLASQSRDEIQHAINGSAPGS